MIDAGTVFLDTFCLLSLLNRDDAHHARVAAVYQDLTARHANLVTSEWVLLEFLNAAAGRRSRAAAIRSVRRLRGSPRVKVERATTAGWEAAFTLYESRLDKEWSLVDCSSILICQRDGIEDVLTHDQHFKQAGLRVLIP